MKSMSFLTELEMKLYCEGNYQRSYEKLGAHLIEENGQPGTHFAVWAPNAKYVSVIGDWNDWNKDHNAMTLNQASGIWTCFIPDVQKGSRYKYYVQSNYRNYAIDKADPYAFSAEVAPQTASRVSDLSGYSWSDQDWMAQRKERNALHSPISIYEVHLGSWRRAKEEEHRWLTYREVAPLLVDYVQQMGFTHVEFLPLMEHPFYGSWGYQTIAYYAPTSRFGAPEDLMYLINTLHQAGIAVIFDWVPSHFPQDGHGLVYFDGTHLYEHADPRQGVHADWGTYVYNYARPEVSNFLISNALFWCDKYHVDGLRVDAVASMLYLDYSRKEGEWVPNRYGGRENLEAIEFLRRCNDEVHKEYPDVAMIAEESTAWPMVSRPTHLGGLGFDMKWNMGWMHDVLDYISQDPIHRAYHHNKMTFGMMYAYSENFILPFSHDEVVHLKKSMLSKMPGDLSQQLSNLRLLFGFMMAHPGKKLLFMGAEFGQWMEWNHDRELDWELLDFPEHLTLQNWVKDLHRAYRSIPAFYEIDYDWKGFEWIDCNDAPRSILSFLRFGKNRDETIACICNFTPIPRFHYRIGVPWSGVWQELLNSDSTVYQGNGLGNFGQVEAEEQSAHGRPYSLDLTLPPLSILILQSKKPAEQIVDAESEPMTAEQPPDKTQAASP
jgi:1,4-alpha-glucan branching enzyme